MPAIKPIKRRDLINYLHKFGFECPYSGGRHQFMQKDNLTLTIPNPHEKDIDRSFLLKILKQAGISRENWERMS